MQKTPQEQKYKTDYKNIQSEIHDTILVQILWRGDGMEHFQSTSTIGNCWL